MKVGRQTFRNWGMLEVAQDCKTSSRLSTGSSSKVETKGKVLVSALKPQRSKQPMRQVSKVSSLRCISLHDVQQGLSDNSEIYIVYIVIIHSVIISVTILIVTNCYNSDISYTLKLQLHNASVAVVNSQSIAWYRGQQATVIMAKSILMVMMLSLSSSG